MRVLFNKLTEIHPFYSKLLIKGRTFKKGVDISCRVRVYSRGDGLLLSEVRSNASGDYILFGLQHKENIIIALDPNSEFNLAAQDNVK